MTLHWRHNGRDGVLNHQPHDCLLKCLFRRRSKKTSQLRVTGLCAGNSLVAGEFLAQMASNAEKVSIRWRLRELAYISLDKMSDRNFPGDIVKYIFINDFFISIQIHLIISNDAI